MLLHILQCIRKPPEINNPPIIKGGRIEEVNGLQLTTDYKLFLFLKKCSETKEKLRAR